MWPIIIATSLWVYFDARRIGIKKGQIPGIANLGPGGWLVVCLLLWIVAFPVYLIKRPQFIRINQNNPRAAWNKTDTVVAVIIGTFIVWGIGIKVQEFQRVPVANRIIEETKQELKNKGFDYLVGLIGKGYIQETITRGGTDYDRGYVVSKLGAIRGPHTKDSPEVLATLKPGEAINEVEVLGYVDCVTVIPIVGLKMGPSFEFTVNKKAYKN